MQLKNLSDLFDVTPGVRCYPFLRYRYNVIRFVSISAKSSIYTVLGLNGTFVKAKIHTWDV